MSITPTVPHFIQHHNSPFYKDFLEASVPLDKGKVERLSAAERYGQISDAPSAVENTYYAPEVNKIREKYARAIPVDYEKVKSPKSSPLMEKRAINHITHKYKYYDYDLPKRIYTDKSLMYA